ncbi:hypothetical protein GE061_002609 [Apolygus lucorum]|uniref:Uncharacterized protein n=1 Tax=Apolygus lucorum TaxID=248454 RepID=A0A8S9X702_APOLU|nr:hypothetical protein GE061_002609 [Apolygus lucorum]
MRYSHNQENYPDPPDSDGLERPSVLLTLENTSVEAVESSIFRSPHLRNVSLELLSDSLKTVGNPSNVARPNVPHSVFLVDMRLQSKELVCDCKIGWIETWARKKETTIRLIRPQRRSEKFKLQEQAGEVAYKHPEIRARVRLE